MVVRAYNEANGVLRAVDPSAYPHAMPDRLLSTREGRLLRVTLNRPDKRNALDSTLCRALVSALHLAAADPAVGAILLTANGKAFCAGMDLTEIEQGADASELAAVHEQLFTVGYRLHKPLITAVHGAALGGGTGLVANCHIVVAAPDATFGLTEIRLGLWPFLVYRAVENAMGARRTLKLSLTGRIFGADEARQYGLVHELADDPVSTAYEIAQKVAASSPTAIESGMRFVQQTRGLNWAESGVAAAKARNELFASEDFREGIKAFREKRTPRWPSVEGESE